MNKLNRGFFRRAVFTAMLAAFAPTASAVDIVAIHPYLEFGLELGGDKLAEEPGGYGTVTIGAGAGFNLAGGALFDLQGENLDGDFLVSAGYLDSNGDEADFSATRLDLIYFFSNAGSLHRFGVGTTFHFNPRLEIDPDSGSGCIIYCFDSSFPVGTTDFDDAVGLSLRYEINFFPDWHEGGGATLGFRYTMIEYESDVKDVDASGLGIYLNVF